MKGVFCAVFMLLIISGCSSEQNNFTTSTKNYRDISEKKYTMREIDSLTADSNFSFSKKNIITPAERKKLISENK